MSAIALLLVSVATVAHVARAPVIGRADLHAHMTMPWFAPGALSSSPDEAWANPFDAAGLRAAHVRLVFVSLFVSPSARGGSAEALRQMRALRALARSEPNYALARSAAEARAIIARDEIALVASLEGGCVITRVDDVDALYAAGVRAIGLVHFTDNSVGGARDDQLGSAAGVLFNGGDGGLTALGVAVVRRMASLGMIVDVSHASERTMMDVLDLAEREGVVVVASHEGSAHRTGRSIGAAAARRLARAGGMIGVGTYQNPIADPVPRHERWPGFVAATCDDVVAHWLHFRAVAGEAALALGSDLGAPTTRPAPGAGCAHGIRNAGDLAALFSTLRNHGADVDTSAERALRLLERAERIRSGAGASPAR